MTSDRSYSHSPRLQSIQEFSKYKVQLLMSSWGWDPKIVSVINGISKTMGLARTCKGT